MAFHIQTIIFKVVAKNWLFDDQNLKNRIFPKSWYLLIKGFREINFWVNFRIFCKVEVIKIWKIWPKEVIYIIEDNVIGNFITSSTRYGIPYSDNYFSSNVKKTDCFMTEIRKNEFCQKVDIYKRNFRHNLAKNGHIDVRITVLRN